ncbi:hypothetical protein RND81_08G065800 [Saponaria officinalis]|uniref:Uncharacterized protein n=1 Tax=Saponaria officinalis TaxID=3572 RepID=A0AAW1J3E6_SAPOF
MVGSNVKFGISVWEEGDLYIPVKSRKNKILRKKPEQKLQDLNFVASTENKVEILGNHDNDDGSKNGKLKIGDYANNLSRFLEATTLFFAAQYFSKTIMKGWRTCHL